MPVRLPECLNCPDDTVLAARLKTAVSQLPPGSLPLHLATTQGGLVDDSKLAVTVLDIRHRHNMIMSRIGVFFDEIVGGCNCHDDPVTVNRYCTLQVSIDASNGNARFLPIND